MARSRKIPNGSTDPEKREEKKELTTTALGYPFDQVASALQKEIRHGDVEAATYWGLLLFKKAPTYAWKRVLTTASEDVGLAAPEVVAQVAALNWAWTSAKAGAWYASPHPLTLAIVLLCRAPKDTTVEDLQSWTLEQIKAKVKREVPEYAIDEHTKLGKERGVPGDRWYFSRHVTFGIPVNEYTRKLWAMRPEWRPVELRDDPSPSEPGEREP
jgi:replication-associated recombination protein RarA